MIEREGEIRRCITQPAQSSLTIENQGTGHDFCMRSATVQSLSHPH